MLDRFAVEVGTALGESNRGLPGRAHVRSRRGGTLEIIWAIDASPEGGLSLEVLNQESGTVLESVKHSPINYQRVVLKGTFPPSNGDAATEAVVVRAMYMRSTVRAIEFDKSGTGLDESVLDLADERRFAAVLGGFGIPSEPMATTATREVLVQVSQDRKETATL